MCHELAVCFATAAVTGLKAKSIVVYGRGSQLARKCNSTTELG